ncbi:MAG: hypothetical protein HZT43_08145 [Exiguobacterium profundum]|nr:MAG: hypothetical protein HZT43_08145 [Exiguobacterium profundum]
MSLRPLVLIALLPLAGCGQNVNVWAPKTWFGYGETPEDTQVEVDESQDPRPLVDSVTSASIEQANGGVIVRATGLPPTQGWWMAELMPSPIENGELVLDFRITGPLDQAAQGTPRSRQVTVAYTISRFTLEREGINRVVVRGERDSKVLRP